MSVVSDTMNLTTKGRLMNKQEILSVIDTTENFNAHIGSIDALNGLALDLIVQVAGVDGEDWTDEECIEVIKEIVDMTNAYRNTHDWN
jgi:hypothetical protein